MLHNSSTPRSARVFFGRRCPAVANQRAPVKAPQPRPAPKGLKKPRVYPGFTLGLWFNAEALKLKGRPLTRRLGTYPECRWPLQGSSRWGAFPRANPGLSSHGPLGRRNRPTHTQGLLKRPNSRSRHFVPGYNHAVPPGQRSMRPSEAPTL
jgi:hypothetical protein